MTDEADNDFRPYIKNAHDIMSVKDSDIKGGAKQGAWQFAKAWGSE